MTCCLEKEGDLSTEDLACNFPWVENLCQRGAQPVTAVAS
jgi:hypothetical protein